MRSYFVSPIAYLRSRCLRGFRFLLLEFGGYFVYIGMQSQMRGESFPMNVARNRSSVALIEYGRFRPVLRAAGTLALCRNAPHHRTLTLLRCEMLR
jgi:hypothetical protein